MKRSSLGLSAIVLAAATTIPVAGLAQSPAAQPQPYRPGVGDLMTMTVQPRHIKLAIAGREKNWAYARYELHELEEALERVVQSWPRWKGLPLEGMVDAISKGPMASLAKAIDASDADQFAAGYRELTEGCNACHQAANVGFVVIKVPGDAMFPDQDFRPQRP